MKNEYRGGNCLKTVGGGLGHYVDLMGAWQEKEGWYFWGDDTPMNTMSSNPPVVTGVCDPNSSWA